MAIQIVLPEEKLTYEAEESTIYYRRISTLKRGAMVKKHTKRGKTNYNKVTADVLAYVVTGWRNVQQAKKDIPFASELVISLPEDTLADILELSGGANPEMSSKEDPAKN